MITDVVAFPIILVVIALRQYVFLASTYLQIVWNHSNDCYRNSCHQQLPILSPEQTDALVTILTDGRQSVAQSSTYLLILEWHAASTPLNWVLCTRGTSTRGRTRPILLDGGEWTTYKVNAALIWTILCSCSLRLRTWNGMSSSESESLSSTSRDEHDATDTSQAGIGLSNPHLFQRERIMLDLINRMHNTGWWLSRLLIQLISSLIVLV